MRKLFVATLVATVAMSAPAAFAEAAKDGEATDRRAMRAQMMERLDGLDLSGFTELMRERAEARFDRLDTDGDGVISRDEFMAATGERAEAMFERMGPDDDGIVSRSGRHGWGRHFMGGPRGAMRGLSAEERAERLSERAAEEFARLDTDGDGMISPEEFEAGMMARAERFSERRQARGDRMEERAERRRGGPRGMMRGGPHFEMPAEFGEMRQRMREMMREGMDLEGFSGLMEEGAAARFDRLDADGDGEISREEFMASIEERAERAFARMDRNEDGVLSRSDRPRWGGMRGRMGRKD